MKLASDRTMETLYAILWSVALSWTVLGAMSVRAVLDRRARRATHKRPPVSLLKPLCGDDPDLESNLRSFFEQDYAAYEIVLGIEGESPAMARIVERLKLAYPHVDARLIVHNGGRAANPKVSNLRVLAEHARHDVLVISDANIEVERGYLTDMVETLALPNTGLVTSLIAGARGRSLGACAEMLYLNGPIVGGVALSHALFSHPMAVGKSMMFRRSMFERLGGFESVSDVLAEDYIMGRMFREAGFRVRLGSLPVRNVLGRGTLRSSLARTVRWSMIRARLNPLAYLLEPLTMPFFVALLGPLFGAPITQTMFVAGIVANARDAYQAWRLGEGSRTLQILALGPVRDVLALAAWVVALFARTVRWRGHFVRVSAGTRLYGLRDARRPSSERITQRYGS